MNNNEVYIVEVQTGGSIIESFNNESEANKYYNDNIKYNPIKRLLMSFKFNNDSLYYYSIGRNVISVYSSNYRYQTKLKIDPRKDNCSIENIKSKFIEYLKNDCIPVF